MTLKEASEGTEYTVSKIDADDEELTQFLFSLGLYSGEKIMVLSHLKQCDVILSENGVIFCVLTSSTRQSQIGKGSI